MCTAATLRTNHHYFGRNLDLEYSYTESITITPRNYPLHFSKEGTMFTHYALIGMAYIQEDYPLYYDATNEMGLSMAGLNFPRYADYKPFNEKKDNITPYEFIPWILGQCSSIKEVCKLLERLNMWEKNFSEDLPLSPLHWIISDRHASITVESVKEGLKVYQNPIGILTNSPSFDVHLFNLNNYMGLSSTPPINHFSKKLNLIPYSNGMGAIGMPGDWSSLSRFVKASFLKMNSFCQSSEVESVSQFFHILNSVEHVRGCVLMENNLYEITQYSSCCNTDKGIYYYKTYENSQITAVDMWKEDLEKISLISYPLQNKQKIAWQN